MAHAAKARRVRFDRWGYIFVTPFFLAFLAFQLYPIVNTFYLGFTDMKGSSLQHHLVGFENFAHGSQSLKLEGLAADKANALIGALHDAGIEGDTDAPAADSGTAAYDLGSTDAVAPAAAPAAAPTDDYSLGTDTPTTQGYFVRVTQLDSSSVETVRKILTSHGVSSADFEKSQSTTYGGLIFDQKFWQAFGNTAFHFY